MRNINLRYIRETFDEKGLLTHLDIDCPDDFNFAYDIVDDIAINDPDRRALIWVNEAGDEKIFTFADIKRQSDKTCNYFASKGIKKGDFVLLVLKNCYQFWIVITALHKMGAIPVPATFMLKPHDIDYRIKAAGIKAAVVTIQTDVSDSFDEAEMTKTLACKFIVGGKKDGWLDYDTEVQAFSEDWDRVPTHKTDCS